MVTRCGRLGVVSSAILGGVLIATCRSEAADTSELRSAVKRLFDQSWEKTADGLKLGAQNYRKADAIAPSDARVEFAWALVQLHYLRYFDAEKTLADAIAADPDLWPARQLKIRLTIVMKKHSAALAEMEQLAERLAKSPHDAAHAQARTEAIEFLGRMFAFYDGPAANSLPQTSLADARGRILGRLTPTDQETFSRGYSQVHDRFAQLDEDKRKSTEAAKEAEKVQKEQDLQRLAAEKQSVDAEKEAIARRAAEAEAVAREAIGKLDAELAPLNAAYAQINAQGAIIRGDIARLDATVGSLFAQADSTDDPVLRATLLQQANFANAQLSRAQANYQALDIQAAQINAQRSGLLQQRAQVVATYEGEMRALGVTSKKLAGNETRIATQTKSALKPATGFTPQVQAKTASAASLATYVELALDRERQRLLASFE
jgi:hypothetical protein